MLAKIRRVTRAEFKSLNRPYKTSKGQFFLLRIFKTSSSRSRFAVSVSKKQEKKAVIRNKIRRLAYRAIQESENYNKTGFIYHLILNQKPKDLKNDITKDVSILLHDFLL